MTGLPAETLAGERVYLLGIAYRMLGSASDAEDVVQEALVRGASAADVRSPRAFLTTVVTRLCLDELGSARRRREEYVGTYLPEPMPTDAIDGDGEQRETVSLALLVVLDQLSPLERAVFVLRDVFDLEFSEIAEALGRSEPACRKLLSRARDHIASAPRTPPSPAAEQQAVANAFFTALATGDLNGLVQVLADEAVMHTDHGGKAQAARRVLVGANHVARFLHGLVVKGQRTPGSHYTDVCVLNGAPALVLTETGGPVVAAFTLQIARCAEGPRVEAVRAMRNPDKLRSLATALECGLRLPTQPRRPSPP